MATGASNFFFQRKDLLQNLEIKTAVVGSVCRGTPSGPRRAGLCSLGGPLRKALRGPLEFLMPGPSQFRIQIGPTLTADRLERKILISQKLGRAFASPFVTFLLYTCYA